MVVSSPDLIEGEYTLWQGENQLKGIKTQNEMGGGMKQNGEMGEDFDMENRPQKPEGFEMPEGERPQKPEGDMSLDFEKEPFGKPNPNNFGFGINQSLGEVSEIFKIENGENYFLVVSI